MSLTLWLACSKATCSSLISCSSRILYFKASDLALASASMLASMDSIALWWLRLVLSKLSSLSRSLFSTSAFMLLNSNWIIAFLDCSCSKLRSASSKLLINSSLSSSKCFLLLSKSLAFRPSSLRAPLKFFNSSAKLLASLLACSADSSASPTWLLNLLDSLWALCKSLRAASNSRWASSALVFISAAVLSNCLAFFSKLRAFEFAFSKFSLISSNSDWIRILFFSKATYLLLAESNWSSSSETLAASLFLASSAPAEPEPPASYLALHCAASAWAFLTWLSKEAFLSSASSNCDFIWSKSLLRFFSWLAVDARARLSDSALETASSNCDCSCCFSLAKATTWAADSSTWASRSDLSMPRRLFLLDNSSTSAWRASIWALNSSIWIS